MLLNKKNLEDKTFRTFLRMTDDHKNPGIISKAQAKTTDPNNKFPGNF